MCGRYTLNKKPANLAKRFDVKDVPEDLRENFNVSPSQIMPVITEDEDGNRHLEQMKWGIPRVLGKD